MRRIIFIGLILLLLTAVFAFADESSLFVKTMPVIRVYNHRLGFKVVYLKSNFTLGDFYVPLRWFDEAAGKGMLIKGLDSEYPYFSIFWKDGEFFLIKLYVQGNLSHASWGTLGQIEDAESVFSVESITLDL